MEDGTLTFRLERVLARRIMKKGNHTGTKLLVQWEGMNEEDDLWVDVDELRKQCPELESEFF